MVRATLAALLLTVTSAASGQTPTDGATPARAIVTIDTGKIAGRITDDYLGLSFEKPVLSNDSLNPDGGNLATLLTNLSRAGHFRFGGTLMDVDTWWQVPGEVRPLWARYTVDRAHLDAFARLVRQTGWKVEMATNLEHFDAKSSADEAQYAAKALGESLFSFACGNEPDLFRDRKEWAKQRKEWEACADVIEPHAKLAGGEEAEGLRPTMLATVGKRLVLATSHFYAQYENCPGPEGRRRFQTESFLTRETAKRTVDRISGEVAKARTAGLPYRISESNAVACLRQDDAGNVFANALWSVDYLLLTATLGVTGVNFHVPWESWRLCSDRMTYSAFCVENQADREANNLRANPLYYGLLTFASIGAGDMLATRVLSATNTNAYTVHTTNGDLKIAVVQKDAPGGAPVRIEISGLGARKIASAVRLEAPSLLSRRGDVRFAGALVDDRGTFTPRVIAKVRPSGGQYAIEVPTGTATILTVPAR